jgi:hypothetical protein
MFGFAERSRRARRARGGGLVVVRVVHAAAHGGVVVAQDGRLRDLAHEVGALVGRAAVADGVARGSRRRRSSRPVRLQHGAEGLVVRVDVAEDSRGAFDAELNEPQAAAATHTRVRCSSSPAPAAARRASSPTASRTSSRVPRRPPWRILAVTFTNKAAGEMRARLGRALRRRRSRDLWVGTFHATCAKLLRVPRRRPSASRRTSSSTTPPTRSGRGLAPIGDLDLDEKRYPRGMVLGASTAKQEGRGPDMRPRRTPTSTTSPSRSSRLRAAARAANAVDFEDLILLVRVAARTPRRRATAPPEVPTTSSSTSSRTRTARSTASARARPRPQEPVRRRRRRPEHLPLARRRRAQHPRLPARLPRARS